MKRFPHLRRRTLDLAILPACVLAGVLSLTASASAADLDFIARQVIIRAPEAKVLDIALVTPEDKPLADQLRAWVRDGTAEIVSDVSSHVGALRAVAIKSGNEVRHATECRQNFETGTLHPSAWVNVFVGTSATVNLTTGQTYALSPHVDAGWRATFSPRDPASVLWPAWWPTVKEPKVNWYDQQDFFTQSVSTSVSFVPGHDTILGMMRRADPPQAEEGEPPPVPTLDVVLAQLNPTGDAVPPADKLPHSERLIVLGYGMKDRLALEVLSRRIAARDAELLDQLRRMEEAGTAKLRMSIALRTRSGQRATVSSVREHLFPTEMPTIPSAWEMHPVGTSLEADIVSADVAVSFEHHPAPPQRLEWKCATDSPKLVMWQPGFFVQQLTTAVTFNDEGAALLGAMRTPDCNKSEDLVPGETLVLIATLQGASARMDRPPGAPPLDPFAAHPGQGTPRVGVVRGAEIEAVVFDVPASEADLWADPSPVFEDGTRYEELTKRVDGKSVKIAAHVVIVTRSGQRSRVSDVEHIPIVTEVDPPEPGFPGRYRPTALDSIPCGTTFEVDPVIGPDAEIVAINYVLQHHVAVPKEPELPEVLAELLRTKGDDTLRATLFAEDWTGEAMVQDGGTRFLGARVPPGDAFKGRLHVAFLRMRLSR